MLPKVKSHQIQKKGDHLRDRPEFMSKCYYVSLVPTLSKKIYLGLPHFTGIMAHLTLIFFRSVGYFISHCFSISCFKIFPAIVSFSSHSKHNK